MPPLVKETCTEIAKLFIFMQIDEISSSSQDKDVILVHLWYELCDNRLLFLHINGGSKPLENYLKKNVWEE